MRPAKLSRLAKEINRCGAENQKTPVPEPTSTPLIDQTPQNRKEFRRAVDLVENDESVLVGTKKQRRVIQFFTIFPRLKVQVECVARAFGDLVR